MKRLARSANMIILACVLVFLAVLTGGCGKSEEAESIPYTPPGPGGGQPGVATGTPTAPTGGPGAYPPSVTSPGAPPRYNPTAASTGAVTTPPGTAATAAPSAPVQPGSPAPTPTGTPAAAPTANNPNVPIPFEQVPLKSPVKRTVIKEGPAELEVLQFKYEDSQGKICYCELPAGEAKVSRPLVSWTAIFDIYKKNIPKKSVATGKKKTDQLHDFPFVSPPPRSEQQGTSAFPGTGLR